MNFVDIVYWGWYKVLDKTIYWRGVGKYDIGPREHAFFLTFLFHGLNIGVVLRYLLVEYFNKTLGLYPGLFIAVMTFFLGYIIYFKRKRVKQIIEANIVRGRAILYVIIALIYVIISIYLMLKVGDYVRYKYNG